ncbi:MAG: AAA family ATPase [Patescibacteria group bacterium]|nr:MAG: AAA family ATPase [Patescibacteria group bacterium]
MLVALTGTHGVGKTSVFEPLKLLCPEAAFFSEAVRHQMKAFGFGHPINDFCRTYGIGAFELMNMNAWSVIDPAVNTTLLPGRLVITDRCAVDSIAYYLAMRSTVFDSVLERPVLSIARYYASLYDRFVYFPCGVFPLVGDAMRPADAAFQQKVDACLWQAFDLLEVPERKIHRLQATDLDGRLNEMLSLLPAP